VQPGVALYRKVFEITARPDKNDADQEYFKPAVRRPTMEVELPGGGKQEIGEVITDKALNDELKKQRIALRGRTTVVTVEEDEPEGGQRATDDDIPF
jgi:hypothetical protein